MNEPKTTTDPRTDGAPVSPGAHGLSLLACPWCGELPEWDRQMCRDEPDSHRLRCVTFNRRKCGGFPCTPWYRTRSGAINAWNRRK